MRSIVLFFIVASPVLAQFWELSTTDDGRQLYFGSSLVLSGSTNTPTPSVSFLYKLDQDGIHLVSNHAVTPQVSGDGQVLGYTDPTFCSTKPNPASCVEAMVLGPPLTDLGTGDLQLSRNGRWALIAQVGYNSADPPVTSTLVDLKTGGRTLVPPRPADERPFVVCRSIASNGSLLVQARDGAGRSYAGLWQDGKLTTISVPFSLGAIYQPLALSDDAQTYFYSIRDPLARLIRREIADGTETVLFTVPVAGQEIYFMGASRDSRTALIRYAYASAPGPAYLVDTFSGRRTLVPLAGNELVTDGTLSGSGDTAYLATSTGRMVKLTVTTGTPGAIQQIIAPTPYLSSGGTRPIEVFPVAPGQVVRLWSPLERSADFWNGRILFDNRPAAVLSAQGGQVEIQMPWDVPVGFRSFRLDVPSGDSPFEQNQGVYVNSAVPVLPLGLAMVLGDFSGLVTTPPSPGDIVHFYMTGLGAVSGSPPLGRPAPADVLFPLQGTLTCLFLPQTTPAQTIFAGLAPGMIGIYQIDFRMPADPNPAPINGIACTLNQAVGQWRFAYCVGQNCGSEIHYP